MAISGFRSSGASPLRKRLDPEEEEEDEANMERPANRAGHRSITPSRGDLSESKGAGGGGGVFNPYRPRLVNQMIGGEEEASIEDELVEGAYAKGSLAGPEEEEEEEGVEAKTQFLDSSMTSMLPPNGVGGTSTTTFSKKKKKKKKKPAERKPTKAGMARLKNLESTYLPRMAK